MINYFSSLFPFGCHLPINSSSSHRKRTVLDCVYNFKLKKYFILDIIEWMGVPYTEFDVCLHVLFVLNLIKNLKNSYCLIYFDFRLNSDFILYRVNLTKYLVLLSNQ